MLVTKVAFEPRYANAFKDLNVAWLEKFFFIEPKDEILLKYCKDSIIKPGGFIFLAKSNTDVVGCFSFIRIEENSYKLGKMAVHESYEGHSFGQQLMRFAISFAKQQQWNKLILYSSSKLPAALHIYEKFGFAHVPLENDIQYTRSDVKMELDL